MNTDDEWNKQLRADVDRIERLAFRAAFGAVAAGALLAWWLS